MKNIPDKNSKQKPEKTEDTINVLPSCWSQLSRIAGGNLMSLILDESFPMDPQITFSQLSEPPLDPEPMTQDELLKELRVFVDKKYERKMKSKPISNAQKETANNIMKKSAPPESKTD
ncbi:hypothetical protein ACOME3_004886 [Neoechinorhynchus agilis]